MFPYWAGHPIFLLNVLEGCLQPNPEQRLSISSVLERVAAIGESNGYNFKTPLILAQNDEDNVSSTGNNINKVPPVRPAPPNLEPARPAPAVMFIL